MVTRFAALIFLLSMSTLSYSFAWLARKDIDKAPSPAFRNIRRHVFQIQVTGEVPLVANRNLTMMLLPPWYQFRRPKKIVPPLSAPLTVVVPPESPHSPITIVSTQSD